MSCYVIKAMDNVYCASIQFGIHLDSWECTLVARDALSCASSISDQRYLRALPTIRVHPELDGRTLDIVHSLTGARGKHAILVLPDGKRKLKATSRRSIFLLVNYCIEPESKVKLVADGLRQTETKIM